MYAILVANALSPLIGSITQPRVYGETRDGRGKGAES
jgi:Na+-translocating ferredoxin:NAD+ oxidoreductase RnfD subunit